MFHENLVVDQATVVSGIRDVIVPLLAENVTRLRIDVHRRTGRVLYVQRPKASAARLPVLVSAGRSERSGRR